MFAKRHLEHGGYTEWSFTKVLFIFVFFAMLWMVVEWGMGFYDQNHMANDLKAIIYQSRNDELDELKDKILKRVQVPPHTVDKKQLSLAKTEDTKHVIVKFPYLYVVDIPLVNKQWEIPFSVDLDVDNSPPFSVGNQ